MKILVLSDSHGDADSILCAVSKNDPDKLIFLGDGASDLNAAISRRPGLDCFSVSGNCDITRPSPRELLLDIEGFRILATHGDKYHVKNGLLTLNYRANEKDADIVLFGHTHVPYCEDSDGVWYLNPGSCRRTYGGTCGLIEINGSLITCHLSTL